MTALVLDAAVALAWCVDSTPTPLAVTALEEIQQSGAMVPGIWPLEVANVVGLAERRGAITAANAQDFLRSLLDMGIGIVHAEPTAVFTTILDLARTHHLTTYDAAYLELALRLRLPLATLDADLRKAAKKAGAKLFAA